jgi:hypothetical protein
MSTRARRKQMDRYQCQICGDWHGKIYPTGVTVQVEAHHIRPKSEGGKDRINNLITVCDLCHAVVTPQRWKEYFGEKGTPQNMGGIKIEFNEYLESDVRERERIKRLLWDQFGINPR